MKAHCQDIKRRHPEAKTVFIGPCVAKKDEAEHADDLVDAVLTFEELTAWLKDAQIELRQELAPKEESRARFFPTPGGILKTMAMDAPGYSYMAMDGVETCIMALRDIGLCRKLYRRPGHGKISPQSGAGISCCGAVCRGKGFCRAAA